MKRLYSTAALGLALALSLGACKRNEAPGAASASAPATADAAPVAMQKIDTVTGAGKEAVAGATVVVNYTGWLYAPNAEKQHGAQFDSSIGREPFSFQLGGGQVIPGWDQGVQGMKVGGKRTLVIPAALGYGDQGAGPIPPNSTLVFDIELLDVK
jgi:FKBP-type peptidyl-prolyl cis-trans isomerase FkpA